MFRLLSGIFLGWSLGSNDSANIFGTAVASKTIKYRTAIITCALFILAGALLEGQKGLHTLSNLTTQNQNTAFLSSLAAALTVSLMTFIKLPVSASQAVVGAIIGVGLALGPGHLDFSGLEKVFICWVGTPLGTALVSAILYPLLGRILEKIPMNIFTRDYVIKFGLLLAGAYGAYALGANNVANITGVFTQSGENEGALLTDFQAVLIGGVSMACGVLTFSRNVMITVGKKLVRLDPFTSLIAVLSEAIVVHFYAKLGVPVSTSQAIIGAVLGIGLLKGVQTINLKTLLSIFSGWVITPLFAAILAYAGILIYKLI